MKLSVVARNIGFRESGAIMKKRSLLLVPNAGPLVVRTSYTGSGMEEMSLRMVQETTGAGL